MKTFFFILNKKINNMLNITFILLKFLLNFFLNIHLIKKFVMVQNIQFFLKDYINLSNNFDKKLSLY